MTEHTGVEVMGHTKLLTAIKDRVYLDGEYIFTVYPTEPKWDDTRLDGESWIDMRDRTKEQREHYEKSGYVYARRIVSCVNACAGVEVPENYPMLSMRKLIDDNSKLSTRVAELEGGLKEVIQVYDSLEFISRNNFENLLAEAVDKCKKALAGTK